ncbi:MAG: hypothetical protein J6X88_07445 [Bacteroidales bacterium]|nr:hypothetical protein [Bacteroidales bacterium]
MNTRRPYLPPTITIVGFLMEKGYQASPVETPSEHQFRLMMDMGEGNQQRPLEQFNYHDGWGETDNHFFPTNT